MLVLEWRHDMKHQKAPGRQLICYGLFCAVLYFWWTANNFTACLQWKCQNFGIRRLWRRLLLLTTSL